MLGQQPESPVVVAYAGVSKRPPPDAMQLYVNYQAARQQRCPPTSSTLMRRITLQGGAGELDHSIETKSGTRANQHREGRIRSSFIG